METTNCYNPKNISDMWAPSCRKFQRLLKLWTVTMQQNVSDMWVPPNRYLKLLFTLPTVTILIKLLACGYHLTDSWHGYLNNQPLQDGFNSWHVGTTSFLFKRLFNLETVTIRIKFLTCGYHLTGIFNGYESY